MGCGSLGNYLEAKIMIARYETQLRSRSRRQRFIKLNKAGTTGADAALALLTQRGGKSGEFYWPSLGGGVTSPAEFAAASCAADGD